MPQVFRKNTLNNNRLQVKLFGQWEEAIRVINRLSPEIKKQSLRAQLKVCEDIKLRVLGHLINQDLDWKSLNKNYSKRKTKNNLDSRTLIAWGSYYHAIDSWTVGNRHLAMVGVRTGIYTKTLSGKKNPLEVAKIAIIHEFSRGTKIPKRPLWNPTIKEMGGGPGLKKLYSTHLINLLRRAGVPIKPIQKKLF